MYELARVTLENEMDLILAHKRSMRLAEIAGLSLSAQTTFATAVSEVARNTIEHGKSGCLILNVDSDSRDKYIVACLKDENNEDLQRAGLEYAKKLVNKYSISTKGKETSIELFYYIAPSFKIDFSQIDQWRSVFRNELPLSPYEELKRKNEQLQDLSDKVHKNELQYKTLTNSLPLLIFSLDAEGQVIYANAWLTRYSGETIDSLNASQWKYFVFEEDYFAFSSLLKEVAKNEKTTLKSVIRLKNQSSGAYLWHQLSLTPLRNDSGDVQNWIGYLVDIHAQKAYEETLKDNIELKQTQEKLNEYQRVQEKYITELNRSNLELQQFAFIASHDLQEPVRKLLFYSDFLMSQYTGILEGPGIKYLTSMQQSAQRMRVLIKDLLVFSQIKKEEIVFRSINLNTIIAEVIQDFEMLIEEKKATLQIDALPALNADEMMMRQLFENLISNALKYSSDGKPPVIEINGKNSDGCVLLTVKDNGIGFDEKYLPQMFTLFQRLHNRSVYEGTGLGLAICKKIVEFHNGKIWAQSTEGKGSAFSVSLPGNL